MRVRKKPVEVDAFCWLGSFSEEDALVAWASGIERAKPFQFQVVLGDLFIVTKEGSMQVPIGNYIICGIAGEFYSCDPAIFRATYEEVPVDSHYPEVPGEEHF
jgi:hypothetical protein